MERGMLLLVLIALATATLVASEGDVRVSDLIHRQASSKDGIVSLDDTAVKLLAASVNRPYGLLVFFDALHLRERSELKLEELKNQFGLVARTYIKTNAGGPGESKVFFCSLEFQESQASFAMFGVNSLPHVRYLPPGSALPSSAEAMDFGDLARSAEGMASFLESRMKYKVGQIERPPMFSKKQMLLVGVGLAMIAPLTVKHMLVSRPLQSPKLWCVGALFVYFFSVSGGMHNIIRKMPLFMADRKNPGKLVFFYQGSGMQLGAEGFVVAYLYTVVGLMLAFITHMLVTLRSKVTHRLVMLLGLTLCFWSVRKVVSLDNWKTGYGVHAYLPTGWRR